MPLPMRDAKVAKKPLMIDDPSDDMGAPHAEPEGDESYINDIMGKDIMKGAPEAEDMGEPLEMLLVDAGYKVSPEQLDQIKAIIGSPMGAKGPVKAPGAGAAGGAVPSAAKPNELGLMK